MVLFWIFLWQLKNYHIGRFVDHFRTHQGKKLIFDPLLLIKIVLVLLILVNNFFIYLLLMVYAAELLIFGLHLARKNIILPTFTPKVIFLTGMIFLDLAGYFYVSYAYIKISSWFILALLAYDILTPLIVSLIILFFQPFFVMARNRILQKAQKKIATFKNLTVIGITGSYGKTSTKEFLTAILSAKFNVLATPEHKNSEIGIAQTILSKDFDRLFEHETRAPFEKGARPSTNTGASVFIVEMGAYNKGGIRLLCDIVRPAIGIVTGVNEQHLATFGSLENLLSAEGGRELAQGLPKDGLIIVNGDNKYCLDLYKKVALNLNALVYTAHGDKIDSDIWTEDITMQKDSLSFIARTRQKELAHITVNVLGRQNVQNMLAAILAARRLGMDFEQIIEACKNIKEAHAGMTVKKGKYGISIIDSSYSSNPDGVMADLDYVSIFSGKKAIIMPCLIELAGASANAHYDIGKKIAEVCDMAIITTRDQFEQIKKGATENGMAPDNIIFCANSKDIFTMVTTACKEGDAVLLEGRVPGALIKLLYG